jgi:hypothetical protein
VPLPAAIVRCCATILRGHALGRAGHDLVHDRFCIELMVSAVESIYDEGAGSIRLTEVAAAG